MESVALDDTRMLIRMEYHEMPALNLTFWQAQRLWNLSEDLCDRALQSLVREQFLMVTATGTFVGRPGDESARGIASAGSLRRSGRASHVASTLNPPRG